MTHLYEQILPQLQAINEEGGNMSSHLIQRQVLDEIDARKASTPSAAALVRKLHEKLDAYRGKRHHAGFNAIFEAYTEALFFLAADCRGVPLRAIPDGSNRGQTPDFESIADPPIGLEVKTLNSANPVVAVDDVMNRGFEAAYEAEQRSREAASKSTTGVGIGFGETVWAPHGEGVSEFDAVVQTMSKIDSNVKAGQYEGRPTFLVVSLARLGVHGDALELRRWVDDAEGRRNGHLYTIAAHPADTAFHGYHRDSFGEPSDLGLLPRVGVLRDHPNIAGIIFIDLVGREANGDNYFSLGVRLHGVWNTYWEQNSTALDAEKAGAKSLFDQLCDAWNDLEDQRAGKIIDDRSLHNAFFRHLEKLHNMRGSAPAGPQFEAFMIEADRLHFAWRGTLRKVDSDLAYEVRDPADIFTGVLDDGRPVISWAGAPAHPKVPPMALVKSGPHWGLDEGVGTAKPSAFLL